MQKFGLLRKRVAETAERERGKVDGEVVRSAPPGAVLDSALLVMRQRVEAICSEESLGVLVGAKKLPDEHQRAVDEAVAGESLTFGQIVASADRRIRWELEKLGKVDRAAGMRPQHKAMLEEVDAYLRMEPLGPEVEDGTLRAMVWARGLVSLLEEMGRCSLADRSVRPKRRRLVRKLAPVAEG